MTSPDAGHVGARVSIRVVDANGHSRDLVGVLTTPTTVRRRDGSDAHFDPAAVSHWRLVPQRSARAGTGAPLRIRIRELEAAAAATWPAAVSVVSGGWLLRASGGRTQRANSALPLGDPPRHPEQAVALVVEFARAEGIMPAIQIPLPTFMDLDAFLEGRGWVISSENEVLVHDTAGLVANSADGAAGAEHAIGSHRRRGARVELRHEDEPSEDWWSVQGSDEAVALMRRWPADYVSAWADGAPVGAGRIAFADDWGMITGLYVTPRYRGTGIATTVLSALAATARDSGVDRLALQVSADNSEALRLYARLGFRHHHRYRHRRLAGPPGLAEPTKGAS